MSTTDSGRSAEELVAHYLNAKKHKILATNWRVRRAEVDIISKCKKIVYFTEVKYRKDSNHGSGFDYITPTKLKQMRFAAELWVAENDWAGDYSLQAAAVDASGRIEIVDC